MGRKQSNMPLPAQQKKSDDKQQHKPAKIEVKTNQKLQPKLRIKDLMQKQKEIEQERRNKRLEIEAKRLERIRKRKERNICMQKLTRKGQPIMKHRIQLLLKELTS